MTYKCSTALNAKFLGVDGQPDSPGFIVLKYQPEGIPKEIKATPIPDKAKVMRDIKHVAVIARALHACSTLCIRVFCVHPLIANPFVLTMSCRCKR
jgi:hypothetical protein